VRLRKKSRFENQNMENCCHSKQKELEKTAQRHKSVLWIVLFINLIMFVVELLFGIVSNSLALVGDSLDMLGDAITYGSSILVVGMSAIKKARVASLKAWIMLIFGLAISLRCIYKAMHPEVPTFDLMLSIGVLALFANFICLLMLKKHKEDDINMKSVWICSRNDIIANSSVILAAFAVLYTGSSIPDLIVGAGLTILFTRSAVVIFREVNSTINQKTESPL
jgi:Co/Zn/Cd efflux system component